MYLDYIKWVLNRIAFISSPNVNFTNPRSLSEGYGRRTGGRKGGSFLSFLEESDRGPWHVENLLPH
jgi:hypothetical protein